MMDHNTYKVFQYIIDHPKQDLHLDITSNFCPPDPKLKTKYFNMLQKICLEEKFMFWLASNMTPWNLEPLEPPD